MISQNSIYLQVRTFLRRGVLDVLGSFSTPAPGVHILNGHRTENESEPETFCQLLNALSSNVSFIRIEDAVKMIINQEHPDKPLVAFTFVFVVSHGCIAPYMPQGSFDLSYRYYKI